MALVRTLGIFALPLWAFQAVRAQTYTTTYQASSLPVQSEQGQTGTNQCGTGYNQTSLCQNVYINSLQDFCLFAPPDANSNSTIGNTERIEVAWCMKSGYGTRIIPDGTITGAHFVKTPDYVQITGVGDLTKLNIPANDTGGELDPHGADGNGNPIGAIVFSSAFTGQLAQLHEWTNFMGSKLFCFRGCRDSQNAPRLCQHIYDEMGCNWNMPGDYDTGFDQCSGDDAEPMGVYNSSTFFQGQSTTPSAHSAPATSSCTTVSTISNGITLTGTNMTATTSKTTTGTTSTRAAATGNSALLGPRIPAIGLFLAGFGIALGGTTV
ncbi:hypothetical protein BC826DRAFT_955865 [Russula brevipes]|nr:hypothetical protein BC826DRAFT_955865 [Russula brevipes]